jgi:hypothetical protein
MLKVCGDTGGAREPRERRPGSGPEGLLRRTVGRLQVMSKRVSTVSIEDLVASIETARDKVMADEVKSLVKLGLPKTVAYKMVADRYRQRAEGDDGEADAASPWPDMS